MIRTFVAIEMPPAVRDSIGTLEVELRSLPVRVSWVRPGNIHLTLKFLGEIDSAQVELISDALTRVGARTPSFTLSVETLGFFPNGRRPRVVWVGIREPNGDLERLAKAVEKELSPLGFQKEKRGFSPHLTFGRIRDGRNSDQIVEAVRKIHFEPQRVLVREMVFMKSTLTSRGSIYEPLKRIAFSKSK